MLGVHGWIHTITVLGLAILAKEYLELRKHCGYLLQVTGGNASNTDIEHVDFSDAVLIDFDDMDGLPFSGVSAHTTLSPPIATQMGGSLLSKGSTVWCYGTNHTDRICRFRDLCYLPTTNDFVFFHGNNSLYEGLPANRFEPALLDFSSVKDHNMQYFNFVDLPAKQAEDFDITYIPSTSLIFNRFNPDNIMHVIHDDLLPVFHTLLMITGHNNFTSDPFDVQLILAEGWKAGDYFDLYGVLSSYKPILLTDLKIKGVMTCFNDAVVGLSKATTWYQYGFHQPQGPIPNHQVTGLDIHQFTDYLKHQLDTENIHVSDNGEDYIVLLTRRHNRLILNEMDLSLALVKQLKRKVLIVGAETHTNPEMIAILDKASVLIGMHGSLLSLSMFLPPGATIIELFPYAVNPEHYTPYKTLASLPGMGLIYKSWRNRDPQKSVAHPDRSWETGGISHLPKQEQEHIKNSVEVPKHLCCRNPEWLYRIYQDTVVDIPQVLGLVQESLKTREEQLNSYTSISRLIQEKIYPSEVLDLKCVGSGTSGETEPTPASISNLSVSWQPPWNLNYMGGNGVKYEVWIQQQGEEDYTAWILSKTSHQFTGGLKPNTRYHIWVRCIMKDDVKGPFNRLLVDCST